MTGEKEFFAELNTNVTGHVCFGDGSKVEIKGKGTLLFQCKNGDQLMIPQVYFTPALTSNILSLGQMTEDGYDICMRNEFLKVRDVEGKLVMKVQRSKNRLYKIVLQHTKPICLATKVEEDAWLWHARFAHANFQLLEQMGKRGHVNGLPIITHPNQLCEGCLIAKQARGSFPNKALWRATRPLELLHADLCGPITPKSHAGTSSHEVEMTHTPNLQHATNEGSSQLFSSQLLDNTPLQGKRNLNEVYNAKEAMSEQEVQDLYAQEGELYLINDEPESYVEAMVDPNWKKAMDLELDSINKNKTWTLVDLPKDHKAIRLKWVFKLKKDTAGNVIKHKARVVAKGYVQQKGIDFDDAFAPVARLETIRLLLALAAKGN
ncbi:putative RNA-directed DNA polymerase [Helianthus annuus]|nr:putative RNA-directed DNA polymerase [Helianthus annuus]